MAQNPSRLRVLALPGLTILLLPRAPYCVRYTPVSPVAGFAFESQKGRHAFASDRVRPFHAAANGLAFTPEGCSIYSEAPEGGEYLTITGDRDRLADLIGRERGLPERQFSGRVHEAGLDAAYRLRRYMLTGFRDPCAAETAASDFLASLGRVREGDRLQPPSKRSLTPRRLTIVEDLIEARYAERLSLGEMAEACGLSPGFFLRAFKAATSQTPHQYLMSRRLSKARQLLGQAEPGLAEIAFMTGFCSQAHMTAVFKRALGATPAAYRQSVLS